jgi:predicted dehydrogenase
VSRMRFGLVGTGWRADFFLRLAKTLPANFEVVGVTTRDAGRGAALEAQWSVPSFRTPSELIEQTQPEFVVASVTSAATPSVVTAVAALGVPILAETPPAIDLAAMRGLWSDLAEPGLVQVAEQYPYLPRFQAYRSIIDSGLLGTITSAQISWTHGYHAVALLRGLLGVGFTEATVDARRFHAPVVRSLGREGWPSDFEQVDAAQTIATLDFGDRFGLYDFTDGQWFHPLLGRRVTVRGERGEIIDDRLTRLLDPRTPVAGELARRQTGVDGDLEGFDLDTISFDGVVHYRNPFPGRRLSDEDVAIATVMAGMGSWVRGEGPAPYPLAQACQDQALSLAIEESADRGQPVTVDALPWST